MNKDEFLRLPIREAIKVAWLKYRRGDWTREQYNKWMKVLAKKEEDGNTSH
jgi:hypothetical protein